MKVNELIKLLQDCDPEAYVVVNADLVDYDYEGWIEIDSDYVEPMPCNPYEPDSWAFMRASTELETATPVIVIG